MLLIDTKDRKLGKSHDRPHPEGARNIEEKKMCIFLTTALFQILLCLVKS